jgi:hypothetical protein
LSRGRGVHMCMLWDPILYSQLGAREELRCCVAYGMTELTGCLMHAFAAIVMVRIEPDGYGYGYGSACVC